MRAVIALCLWSLAGAAPAATPDETARQLKETVERLNALDEWFSEAEQKRAIWVVELQRQDRSISRLNQDVAAIRTEYQATSAALKQLNERLRSLQAQRQRQAEMIGQHVGAAYRMTGQDVLKQLLNQESPDTLDRMMRYHRLFSQSRLSVLAEYQATQAQLESTNAELTAQQGRQREQRGRLEAEQQSLASEREDRATLIARLDREKESKTTEYERLDRDRERLEQLLAELRRRATELDGTAFQAARGRLPMPVQGPVRHAFGGQRAEGRLRWHGIEIAAPQGAPVTSVFRGRVVFADWLRGFGFLTIVDHGSDYMTLYGHADVLHKKVGDWVESGEVIAGAGNSGGQTESGVYFEVRHKGEPKDPIGWVSR